MSERNPSLLPPDQLIRGRVYKLESRNLSYGGGDGKRSFIGVRTKFGSRFLDEEDHWDIDNGTVGEAIDTGRDAPSEISLETQEGLLGWLIQLENGLKEPDFESGADALKEPEPNGSGSMRA